MASEAAQQRYPYPQEEPQTLLTQQHALSNLGQLLLDGHADVNDHVLTLAESWRSDAATQAVSDVGVLSRAMKGDSTALADAASAVSTYRNHVSSARTDIAGIRRRFDEATVTRDEADTDTANDDELAPSERREYREAHQLTFTTAASGLDGEYDTVLTSLKTQSAPAVTELDATLARFVGANPPQSASLGEVAYQRASAGLDLTGDTAHEFALRQAGLLSGPTPQGAYAEWLENAERNGVDPGTIVQIAQDHDITPEDFAILDGLEEVKDPDGYSYFLLPDGTSGDDARLAVLMTAILNAGTGYGAADDAPGVTNDYEETAYSSAEIQRIIDRQNSNDWSYDDDVPFVQGNGGRLMTTPNGMLMGIGGNWLQDLYSQKGGTTWGDIFMLNIDGPKGDDATFLLRQVAASGLTWYDRETGPGPGTLDLDRLLHHEERHSEQWADEGYTGFLGSYLWEQLWGGNETEEGAGLSDGGYR